MTESSRVASLVSPFLAALVAVAVGAVVLCFAGADVSDAGAAFLRGTATKHGLGEVLLAATPLLLCGLSVAISFRAGLFNIGAEGQLLAGMIAAAAWGTASVGATPVGGPGALLGAAFAGAAVAGVAAWLHLRRRVPEVLATLLLNFVLLQLVGLSVHGFLQEAAGSYPQSDAIANDARLPRLFAGARIHAGVLIALGAAWLVHRSVERSVIGLRWRTLGSARRAARLAGFPVERDLWLAFLAAGALAGLAGGVELCGVTGRLYENPSGGVGYAAIAVALLGRLRPAGVVAAAFFFGALDAGCLSMEREGLVSHGLAQALTGMCILVFLALESGVVAGIVSRRRARAEAAA